MGRTRYSVRDEIKDTTERFYRAVSNKNLKAIEALWVHAPYAAVAGRSGEIRHGWDGVRAYFERRFQQMGDTKVTSRLNGAVVHAVGDVAWISGTEVRTVTDGDAVRRETLRMTSVLERQGDAWEIVSYHASEAAGGQPPAELAPAS